jgi:ribosomal protein L40E
MSEGEHMDFTIEHRFDIGICLRANTRFAPTSNYIRECAFGIIRQASPKTPA